MEAHLLAFEQAPQVGRIAELEGSPQVVVCKTVYLDDNKAAGIGRGDTRA